MNAPSANDVLQVVNRTAVPARVWLHCAGARIWDVWVGPAGAIAAPEFAPPRVMIEARMRDRSTCVAYTGSTPWIASASNVTARLERVSGASLFALQAQESDGAVSGALRLANTCAEPMEYVARYVDSPYVLRGCLAARATRSIQYGPLEMTVILGGISVQRVLPTTSSRWAIVTLPGSAGFAVVDAATYLDERRDRGVAVPIALHGIAN